MPPDSAILAENLCKRYSIGSRANHADTLRERLTQAIAYPFKRLFTRGTSATVCGKCVSTPRPSSIWALNDVSFEIKQGEVVGIIGKNGAGKSTLLKILSRIVEPTSGRAQVRGRVASLLEVGTGFHAELTGRENIYLSGAILGMPRADVRRRFDEIVSFAGLDAFIDTPVKRYSSGMYVRLAFAVGAHLDPDVLLVDEVLSVGDMAFQRKCLERIQELKLRTRAIILVTHSMILVRATCPRVLLLNDGQLAASGSPQEVVPLYEKAVFEADGTDEQESGLETVRIESLQMYNSRGQQTSSFTTGEPMRIDLLVSTEQSVRDPIFYVAIRRPDGFIVTAASTDLDRITTGEILGRRRISLHYEALQVTPGHYVVDATVYDNNFHFRTYFLGRRRSNLQVVSQDPSLDEKYGLSLQQVSWDFETDLADSSALGCHPLGQEQDAPK